VHVTIDGAQVRTMRRSPGFTGARFAREVGILPSTLNRVKRNRGPAASTAHKIGAALDVAPRDFAEAISRIPA